MPNMEFEADCEICCGYSAPTDDKETVHECRDCLSLTIYPKIVSAQCEHIKDGVPVLIDGPYRRNPAGHLYKENAVFLRVTLLDNEAVFTCSVCSMEAEIGHIRFWDEK